MQSASVEMIKSPLEFLIPISMAFFLKDWSSFLFEINLFNSKTWVLGA
jgi:hypothetical protein